MDEIGGQIGGVRQEKEPEPEKGKRCRADQRDSRLSGVQLVGSCGANERDPGEEEVPAKEVEVVRTGLGLPHMEE
jgi:hypothetical protein